MIDVDLKSPNGLWLKEVKTGAGRRMTLSARRWYDMRKRCVEGGTQQIRRPTYRGCYASELFQCFQSFTDWHVSQIGYGISKYQLDKDLLQKGNKLYGETTCVLVPRALNLFLVEQLSTKGNFPAGVSKNSSTCFTAKIFRNGSTQHLGCFKSPEEAHLAYKTAKEAEAYRWYERLQSGEFIVDTRVVECMRTWKLPNLAINLR